MVYDVKDELRLQKKLMSTDVPGARLRRQRRPLEEKHPGAGQGLRPYLVHRLHALVHSFGPLVHSFVHSFVSFRSLDERGALHRGVRVRSHAGPRKRVIGYEIDMLGNKMT